jgi:hypothetical protein
MEVYKVEIRETLAKIVAVVADDIDIAISTVKDLYRATDIVLDDGDFIDVEFSEYEE